MEIDESGTGVQRKLGQWHVGSENCMLGGLELAHRNFPFYHCIEASLESPKIKREGRDSDASLKQRL